MASYNITITGELQPGADRDETIAALAQLFKVPEAKAATLLDNGPRVVKKGLDGSTADQYRVTIERTGACCSVDSVPAEATPAQTRDPGEPDAQPASAPATSGARTHDSSDIDCMSNPPGLMPFRIEGRPDFSYLAVAIPADETLKVEGSAMATMDTHLVMKTKTKGGFGRFLTGESIFINEFTAEGGPGEIGIAPPAPGDIGHYFLQDDTIYLQNSAFVAATEDVEVASKWQGMTRGFFSGEGLFLIRCSGRGDLWFNTYGAMIEREVDGEYVVDTSNIVAFTEGLEYRISKVSGYKSLFFSGEGLVCRFSGKGRLWMQTRAANALAGWAQPFRPVESKS